MALLFDKAGYVRQHLEKLTPWVPPMKQMNLDSLRVFACVARHGNLQRAADELNLTRGAVSQRIKQLEIDHGVILLERQARGVALTPEGVSCREAVDKALVGTDLDPVMEAADLTFLRGDITDEEAKALAQAATEKSLQIPTYVEEMPLADFATSGQGRKVESRVLGETVLWAADNAQVDPGMDLVVLAL